MVLIDRPSGDNCLTNDQAVRGSMVPIDLVAARRWLEIVAPTPIRQVKPGIDPVAEYFARLLNCPRILVDSARKTGGVTSLDSTCKL